MPAGFKYRILVADSDDSSLQATADFLHKEGYVVLTAHDGFEALAELRAAVPEVLVSDLELPRMSGFELLSVVRKRFPGVGVIARSAEFYPVSLPEGVLSDRYVRKGPNSDFEVLEIIRQLLTELPLRASQVKNELAPAWLPKSSTGYVVITCPSCLRSSSIRSQKLQFGVLQEEACLYCGDEVKFRVDDTILDVIKEKTQLERMRECIDSSRKSMVDSTTAIEESKKRMGDG